jgi:hypothetical protein
MRAILTLTMAVLLAAQAVADQNAMTVGQVIKASTDARSLALARKSHALAESGDASGLALHIAAMRADPALEEPARERLLHDSAMVAARLRPDEALEAEMSALETYESRTLVWTDEHGYRETRPLYDFAATSRHVQRIWAEERSRSQTAQAIAEGDVGVVGDHARASAAERAGIMTAFRDAPADQLPVFQPVLLDALDRAVAIGDLAAMVADKTHDVTLLSKVLYQGDTDAARRAIQAIQSPEWAGESVRLLEIAATREDVGSTAILALGRVAATDPNAVDFLFRSLGGPSGSSAAAALARLGDGNALSRLSNALRPEGDEALRRHALLGLRLADSPAADQALAAFARDPDAPPLLVAEVPSWLRD